VAAGWTEQLAKAPPGAPAWRVYSGRAILEAHAAAQDTGGQLVVVSAGLGLVPAERAIPGYGLTILAGAEDDVLARIDPKVSASVWFAEMSQRSPFHAPLDQLVIGHDVIVLALPGAYLDMLAPALDQLPPAVRGRFRIITGSSDQTTPPSLRAYRLPYDDRLDSAESGRAGTRSDFAPRAARHFIERVLAAEPDASAERHADLVRDALAAWTAPVTPQRLRQTDEELLAHIRTQWDGAGGRSGRLLRVLRDDLGLACEQGRAARLVEQVRREKRA
jgi:hypothetical protein